MAERDVGQQEQREQPAQGGRDDYMRPPEYNAPPAYNPPHYNAFPDVEDVPHHQPGYAQHFDHVPVNDRAMHSGGLGGMTIQDEKPTTGMSSMDIGTQYRYPRSVFRGGILDRRGIPSMDCMHCNRKDVEPHSHFIRTRRGDVDLNNLGSLNQYVSTARDPREARDDINAAADFIQGRNRDLRLADGVLGEQALNFESAHNMGSYMPFGRLMNPNLREQHQIRINGISILGDSFGVHHARRPIVNQAPPRFEEDPARDYYAEDVEQVEYV